MAKRNNIGNLRVGQVHCDYANKDVEYNSGSLVSSEREKKFDITRLSTAIVTVSVVRFKTDFFMVGGSTVISRRQNGYQELR